MKEFRIEGLGIISKGEFETLKIDGVSTCKNDMKAANIQISGVLNCTGAVDAGELYCKGIAEFKSNIRAVKMQVEGVVSNTGGSKIEAGEIICTGIITTKGEISADIINAEGCIEADEIVGDQIRIYSHYRTPKLIAFLNRVKSKARMIEATTIDLRGVSAKVVNGRDITIGPACHIEHLDCSGSLYIDESSVVRNITGEYSRRE